MTREPVRMTRQGKERLEEQLQYLKTTRREQISEYMGKAIEDGDLRESAAYDEARMQQSENEAKIAEIEAQLERAQIMKDEEIDTSAVGVGARVIVEDAQNKQRTLEIVGSFEVDVLKGKISDASPMGQALLGKRPGESAVWPGPKGNVSLKVISVEYP
ncbi:transcription elongation factor GreA [Deinococcus radiodurans]|jgi:transcription elongation factor GreA|uniref:Transcription elongation factor GreA n=2 Tax=Bacteria TaxID=2 RepID=Q9RV68_DEIRA|nr:transcription elongation factor GreA [Deinococcus radiodurans]AAF10735.1 transcription elongation factor [Deinococcus radiodurans R1 = ATCC 13939 = DSM 20539]ANC71664.1 transcription elongation factor GreA [Deinococcus radiodurans R1 = ATCC 13939 = DSM 20539]QEM70646.1 transcription elongation factor GreA [Deinococcus radiodurans]QIP29245.1 transcription elongation factor GreA [Deinococcus radiodurans]QIP32063.1 transcription elongation factor GreA [Deinococcus radiodurans]